MVQPERLVRASCFVPAPHMASVPCLSLSLFGALLELEPQHFDDYVAVLVMIVLSASGLVVEDAVVAVSVVVLWHLVAVVLAVESVLMSLSDLVVLVVVHVFFSSLGLLVMPSDVVLSRI